MTSACPTCGNTSISSEPESDSDSGTAGRNPLEGFAQEFSRLGVPLESGLSLMVDPGTGALIPHTVAHDDGTPNGETIFALGAFEAYDSVLGGAARRAIPETSDFVFCVLPWEQTRRPSIATAILKGICSQEGVSSRILYGNFDVAARIGFERANSFAHERPLFGLSEHLFACDIYGSEALRSDAFIDAYAGREDVRSLVPPDYWRRLRDEIIPSFLDAFVERLARTQPKVVGFTSTWNQVMASLAVAKRIKARLPSVTTIFGGACFHHPMGQEYHRALPNVVDHVFLGEADDSFREYAKRWRAGVVADRIPGITYREAGEIKHSPAPAVRDLDRVPTPDYDDYFFEADRVREETGLVIVPDVLPYESSRGCWWGQKNHCTFCGIDDKNLVFRSRSIERIVEDIETILRKYRHRRLLATDLIIAWRTLEPVLEHVRDLGIDVDLFYEVRAKLKKAQIKLLRDAGARSIQPGIESLSTPILELMDKGSSTLTNIQFLRWAKEYGVHAAYNLLMGFPRERPEWYAALVPLISKILHLQPPDFAPHLIELHRFGPLFEQHERFGLGRLVARNDYRHLFPDGTLEAENIAYYFYEEGRPETFDLPDYTLPFHDVVVDWMKLHKSADNAGARPFFTYGLGLGVVKVTDARRSPGRAYTFTDEYLSVLLLCDRIQRRDAVVSRLAGLYSAVRVERAIDELVARDILLEHERHLLTLPTSTSPRLTEELDRIALRLPKGARAPNDDEVRERPKKVSLVTLGRKTASAE